jgi:stage III sporulation protein SpoIIIAA
MSPFSDGLTQFLDVLPAVVRERLEKGEAIDSLVEVVLDYGRPAEARYFDHVERMPDVVVSDHDLEFVSRSIGAFGTDNRAGIERTLHRISAIRNRHGKIIGLTCRVGRALEGTIDIIDDVVRSGKSILLLGRPGIGKTTKLREMARVLADEVGRRVVIVDTSNEIAGDGDVPHPGIGTARRMQVRVSEEQYRVMIEAVENHMPEVIVIDEIGNEAEALAARTIAERGVQLVGTAHGQSLENLMLNPTLADLIGGIQAVTLSDAEAARRGTQKTVLERKAPPTFDVVIELLDYDRLAVHHNVMRTVDQILRGVQPRPEVRLRTSAGEMEIVQRETGVELEEPAFNVRYPSLGSRSTEHAIPPDESPTLRAPKRADGRSIRVFAYGIQSSRLERAIRERHIPAIVTADIGQADAVMTIRSNYQSKPKKLRELAGRSLPTVVVRSNTFAQIAEGLDQLIRQLATGTSNSPEATDGAGMEDVFTAIDTVLQTGKPFELAPQPAPIRKRQLQITESRRMFAEAVGDEPNRRVRITPARLV